MVQFGLAQIAKTRTTASSGSRIVNEAKKLSLISFYVYRKSGMDRSIRNFYAHFV